MKKTMVVVLVSFFAVAVQAQNLSFGPSLGFGHAWQSYSDDNGAENKFFPSYSIGGKLTYSVMTHWGISADLKFSSEGSKRVSEVLGNESKYTYRLNYIRVPLQGIYFFNDLGDPVRPKISLGPSFGFLIGGESKYEFNEVSQGETKSKDMFKTFDVGLNAAVGANFRLGGGKWLTTDITYYHGFTNTLDEDGDLNVKNRGLGINVGVSFPLGTATTAKR